MLGIILRRNSSGSLPAAFANSSMKHSSQMAFWLVLTPRQKPGARACCAWRARSAGSARCSRTALLPLRVETLEGDEVLAVLEPRRNRWLGSRDRRCAWAGRRGRPCRPAQPTACTAHRPVAALAHVLLAAPDQLHRHAGDLLGDLHGPGDVVLDAAPAEAAAEMVLVDLALGRRQAGGPGRGREGASPF